MKLRILFSFFLLLGLYLLLPHSAFAACETKGGVCGRSEYDCGPCRTMTTCSGGSSANCEGRDCSFDCCDGGTVVQIVQSDCPACITCPTTKPLVNYCGADSCCNPDTSVCNRVTCPSGQECSDCWCQTPLSTPTPIPTPTPTPAPGTPTTCYHCIGSGSSTYCGIDSGATTAPCPDDCDTCPGTPTPTPPPPTQTHCTRCSTVNANQWVDFYSNNSNCSTVDSDVTRTCDCSCRTSGLDMSWDTNCTSGVGSTSTLSPSSNISAGTYSLTWSNVLNANDYDVRVNDWNDGGWGCASPSYPNDFCKDSVISGSQSYNFQAGHSYRFWLDAFNTSGNNYCNTTNPGTNVYVPQGTISTTGCTIAWGETSCTIPISYSYDHTMDGATVCLGSTVKSTFSDQSKPDATYYWDTATSVGSYPYNLRAGYNSCTGIILASSTATVDKTAGGTLTGQIWNDKNCSLTFDETNSDYIENPAGSCSAYGSFTYLDTYIKGVGASNLYPNNCGLSPTHPYFSANLAPGSYTASVQVPSGWQATYPNSTGTVSLLVQSGQTTSQSFGLFTCPTFTSPTNLNPNPAGGLLASGPTPTPYPMSWGAVSGATKYSLRIDQDYPSWDSTCTNPNPGDVCTDVAANSYTYTFQPGHTYHWWVHPRADCGATQCWSSYSEAYFTVPGCTVTLSPPSPINLRLGQGTQMVLPQPTITPSGATTVNKVNYSILDADPADTISVSPTSTSTSPYMTAISPKKKGSATLHTDVYLNPLGTTFNCSTDAQVTVNDPFAWLQTQAGDVHGEGGIRSLIPAGATNKNFSMDSAYTPVYPGMVSYTGAESSWGGGVVSSTGWLASSSFSPTNFTYDYFYKKLGSPTTDNFSCIPQCPSSSGTYYVAGDATINKNWNISGGAKIVVLIGGNLEISKQISVPVGSSLTLFVKGNINISGKIGDKSDDPFTNEPHLQGIYFANGQIDTNSDSDQSGNRLVVGGIFYARGGINLKRDLKNDNLTTPAELFIFRPDLVLNSSKETWSGKMSWMEVTP